MLSSSVARLTRQLTQLSVGNSVVVPRGVTNSATAIAPRIWTLSSRTFAVNRRVIDAKNAKRLKIQAKKKKNVNKPSAAAAASADEPSETKDSNQPFLQNQEWVKFQQSISVDGFQTGQVTEAKVLKKSRGGKQARKRREVELAKLNQHQDVSTEKFPAIRYSPEETEELLKLAFSTLPERTGKRGTRNLKRQQQRWKNVRNIRAQYKQNILLAHERRMVKRHWKREQVKEVKAGAPQARDTDLDYQGQILRKWAVTMFQDTTTTTAAAAVTKVEE